VGASISEFVKNGYRDVLCFADCTIFYKNEDYFYESCDMHGRIGKGVQRFSLLI